MTSPSSTPFIPGLPIEDPTRFVGRKAELQRIISRIQDALPTSINVVGDDRIGKSSLLHYLSRNGEEGDSSHNRFFVYLSLETAQCQNESEFYEAIAQTFLDHPWVQQQPILRESLKIRPLQYHSFRVALEWWQAQHVFPVICLDDFDVLFQQTHQMGNGFYDDLYQLLNQNLMMMVVASRHALSRYARLHGFTSRFFLQGSVIHLGALNHDETKQLLQWPAADRALLSWSDQQTAKEWGKSHPYLLQLAAQCLWEAREQNKSLLWAKRQFAIQSAPFAHSKLHPYSWVHLPFGIGTTLQWICNLGEGIHESYRYSKSSVHGMLTFTILLSLGIVLFSQASAFPPEFFDFLKALFH